MAKKKDYTFAVARVRSRENFLLNDSDISALISAKDYNECVNMLSDKGWNTDAIADDYEKILDYQEKSLWEFINELSSDMSEFNVFLWQKDFHNLKASIKAVVNSANINGIFVDGGTLEAETIYKAVKDKNYNALPEHLAKYTPEAIKLLLQTRDGQLCDVYLDKALLDEINTLAEKSPYDTIKLYVNTLTAIADIKTAVRCCKTGKTYDFTLSALSSCKYLDIEQLTRVSAMGFEEICNYILTTDYAMAVDELKKSSSAFEVWCDNRLIENMKPQKYEPFSIGAVVGYIIARENEIKTIRIILAGKQNNLDVEILKERLRIMYV